MKNSNADPVSAEIAKALEVLKKGGTILYPTDTVWGIGCDATNENAVSKIFEIKKRLSSKSMIILLDEIHKLNLYVKDVPAVAWDWVEFSEKPLTVIYSGPQRLATNLINREDNTVAIRIVKDEFCRRLIRSLGKPIVSTSANISGEKTPACFAEIEDEVLQAVDYVVNLRQHESKASQPSAIVSISPNGVFKFIRK